MNLAISAADLADRLTIILGPAGLLVSLLGLAYAIHQIRKTKTAAESAAASAERTSRALVQNHLLFLIPELARAVAEPEAAIHAGQRERASEHLTYWRTSASRARGLSSGRVGTSREVLRRVSLAHSPPSQRPRLDSETRLLT